jgi:DNA primase small subunit
VARTVPLDVPTLAWARERFARYYRGAAVDPPPRLARREFASFPFATETMMRRHAALRSPEELREFLAREVPRHIYSSSAYYRRPAEPTMAAKEWLGADLIFDLDADHLRGAEALTYPEQLRLVKRRLLALVDDFLLGDFGVDPTTTTFAFSGGRGYHVHVRDERFLPLTSPERRELVDYVLGLGVDPKVAIERRREDVRSGRTVSEAEADEEARGGGRPIPRVRQLAPPDAPGWRGRTTRAVLGVLARWEEAGVDRAAEEMEAWGLPRARARAWARDLLERGGAAKIRSGLSLDVFRGSAPDEFLEKIVAQATIEVQGETDAPVTTDIHRLIRLPGSLHGGTGLRVTPLGRDALDGFDPFSDALLPDGESHRLVATAAVRYPFPGGGVQAKPGEALELPTGPALFLVLRGEAALPPSPG